MWIIRVFVILWLKTNVKSYPPFLQLPFPSYLFLFHGLIYFLIAATEFHECIPRNVETPAYIGNRTVPLQHANDDLSVFDQHVHFRVAAFFPTKDDTLGFPEGESLLRAHRNQVAFNFRYQTERETKYLAVDGVVERIPPLGCVKVDSLLQTLVSWPSWASVWRRESTFTPPWLCKG